MKTIWGALAVSCMLTACGPAESPDAHSSEGPHQEDAHAEEGGHDEHGEVIEMTAAQLEAEGVALAPLEGGEIVTSLTLPAEVGFNQDTLLHISPKAPGIAGEVLAYLGDDVAAGQTLAVLQSIELGEAKIALLQALQTEAIAEADLQRQRTISSATERLLEIMRTEPTLEDLQSKAQGLRIGENKGRLISAYARLKAADANHEMEKDLRSKGLSTQASLLVAQETYNSALAEYMGIFEEIDFTFRLRLQEAERASRTAESSVLNAKRRLHLFGMSDEQIKVVHKEAPADIARYEIKAPDAGRIVDKHITPGEKISGEDPIFTIASMGTVWLNIAVYERYLGDIREGQSVVVHAGDRDASGQVVYVSAMLSESTRTMTARVVLENKDGAWRPGEFVTVGIETGHKNVRRRVPVSALQQWEGETVVFVRHGKEIEPRPVQIGYSSSEHVEILGDAIPLGSMVVVRNSFLMKSELGKGAAGHDH